MAKECVELLLAQGANIRDKRRDGQTALTLTAQKNHREVVEVLDRSSGWHWMPASCSPS